MFQRPRKVILAEEILHKEVVRFAEEDYFRWPDAPHAFLLGILSLAERVGFEPTVGVNLHTLSKRAP